jgi:hypothetical protein
MGGGRSEFKFRIHEAASRAWGLTVVPGCGVEAAAFQAMQERVGTFAFVDAPVALVVI